MSGDDENDTNEEENKTIVKNAPSSLPSSADDPLFREDDVNDDDNENTEDETEEEKRVELDRRTNASSITIHATRTTGEEDYEEEATKT